MTVLNDAANYFAALREALLEAQEQVYIVGWDIHSETRLVGASGRAEDGLPDQLGPFLRALVERRPSLRVNILVWDFVSFYASEREWNSAGKFTAQACGRVRFHLDSTLPFGSAQHQKIVCIDGSLAFVGGLDLTIRRWDTSDHCAESVLRRDPEGRPYPPFHDVQCMVDGEAAAWLFDIAKDRWRAAGQQSDDRRPLKSIPWPPNVPVEAEHLPAGIARTEIVCPAGSSIKEVERSLTAAIRSATRFVYIENQFTSAIKIARDLAEQMRRVPSLRVLVVTPRLHSSWLESQAMQNGRGAFFACFGEAGVADRIRFVYPVSRSGDMDAAVMVHSKLMIVDDRILRIGSANLNNRSMGADSECDLILEAASDEHRDFIASVRRRLIAHFCDLDEQTVAQNEDRLFALLDDVSGSGGAKMLRDVESSILISALATMVQPVADPERPLHLERAASRMWSTKTLIGIVSITVALFGLAIAWSYTSLSGIADAGRISTLLSAYSHSLWGPLFAIAAFVVGGLIVFPVLVLIAATAAALGPWLGFITAMAGVLLSAFVLFAIGRALGRQRLQNLLGRRAGRIQERVVGKGVLAVVVIRMIPIAPFSVVNVVAGASTLPLRDFLVGTLLGMMPGILAMAVLGAQIADLARNASWSSGLLLALAFAGWLGICAGAQFVATWLAGEALMAPMRFMTWNVHGTFNLNPKFDLEGVCSIVRKWAPDVVALQEVDSRSRSDDPFGKLASVVGDHRVHAKSIVTEDGDYGQMLLSRFPFSDVPEIVDVSYREREPRRAIAVELLTPVGDVRVVATHLGLSIHERYAQARALVSLVKPERTVVLGDFNDWFWVKSVRRVLAQACPNRTRLRTFPARLPMLRLDRIYATPDSRFGSIWTDAEARAYSDHLPVIADIEI